jgi:hypothetical protein
MALARSYNGRNQHLYNESIVGDAHDLNLEHIEGAMEPA